MIFFFGDEWKKQNKEWNKIRMKLENQPDNSKEALTKSTWSGDCDWYIDAKRYWHSNQKPGVLKNLTRFPLNIKY